ncbi:exopolysaccharide biosynthesis protein [Rhizobium sp. SG2393]|uniref:exopolysaccharide biosynthesis protein n=1 Tax=Rhizobium sp. SG2393 TaxID=3276279 RepID=UPI00367052E3
MSATTTDDIEKGVASRRLAALAEHAAAAGSIDLGEMIDVMGRAGIAFVILALSLPALCPIPGPFGMVFGTCLALVSLQIIVGYEKVWLPRLIRRRRVSAGTIALIVRHTAPLVSRVEAWLKPNRMRSLTGRRAHMLLGIPVFLLAVIVALPIPFGNILPVLALTVIAVSLMERDGFATIIGLGLAGLAVIVTAALLYGTVFAAGWALGA